MLLLVVLLLIRRLVLSPTAVVDDSIRRLLDATKRSDGDARRNPQQQ